MRLWQGRVAPCSAAARSGSPGPVPFPPDALGPPEPAAPEVRGPPVGDPAEHPQRNSLFVGWRGETTTFTRSSNWTTERRSVRASRCTTNWAAAIVYCGFGPAMGPLRSMRIAN